MLLHSTYRATVRAKTHVEVLVLCSIDLIKTLEHYPDLDAHVSAYAKEHHDVDIVYLRQHLL